jgi:site-specific recombinase XerD
MRQAKTAMDRGGVQAAMSAAVAAARIRRRISVHRLRHAFATHRPELGVDLREPRTLLGHAHPETTARYTHLTEVTAAQARERPGRLLESCVLRWRDAA